MKLDIVPREAVPDPDNLAIELSVNGTVRQYFIDKEHDILRLSTDSRDIEDYDT
jgi:hypothetical protein